MGSPHGLASRSEGHASEFEPDDAKDIAEYRAIRTILGHLVTDIDWIIVQDAMLADLTGYRKGLDVLRRFYGV